MHAYGVFTAELVPSYMRDHSASIHIKMIGIISFSMVSVYLYRQTMMTIKEEPKYVCPMTWLEFLGDDTTPLEDLYKWTLDAREIHQQWDTEVVGDEHADKTWLLNMIAMLSIDGFRATQFVTDQRLRRRYFSYTVEELEGVAVVASTLRSMIRAAQARRYIYPYREMSLDEIGWQADRAEICLKVQAELNQMKADVAGGKPLLPEKVDIKAGPLVPYRDDAKRRVWFRTSDDGSWENEAGEKWEEDEHNGMLPYDESGDTEDEDESEEQELGELVEVGCATVQKKWLAPRVVLAREDSP